MQTISMEDIAKGSYEAYRKTVGNKNFRGDLMPNFEELNSIQQNAWLNSAKEAIRLSGWLEDIMLQLIKRGQYSQQDSFR